METKMKQKEKSKLNNEYMSCLVAFSDERTKDKNFEKHFLSKKFNFSPTNSKQMKQN